MKSKLLRLDDDLFEKIKNKSLQEERSVNKEIIIAIKNHLKKDN